MARPLSATVSNSALQHNLAQVRRFAPQSKVMAMVKANAYGHGLVQAAQALKEAEALGVACVEEAVQLRQAGLTNEIVLIEGCFAAEELAIVQEHRLTQIIQSFDQIEAMRRYEPLSLKDKPLTFPVWLKVNTGMNRLGFALTEFSDAYAALSQLSFVHLIGFMTQFSKADERDDPTTMKQLALFEDCVKDKPGARCCANSAGILGWPQSHADWVRPGIMLYGASPFQEEEGSAFNLKPTMQLQSHIIALQNVSKGDSVGYGGIWQSQRPSSRIAIVAIGYGDGYPRHAGSGTPVLVNNHPATIAGRVSMDMLAIDVSDIPEVKIGDPVTLWGDGLSIERVARAIGTIPNELYCRCTNGRFPINYQDNF